MKRQSTFKAPSIDLTKQEDSFDVISEEKESGSENEDESHSSFASSDSSPKKTVEKNKESQDLMKSKKK